MPGRDKLQGLMRRMPRCADAVIKFGSIEIVVGGCKEDVSRRDWRQEADQGMKGWPMEI